MVKWLDFVLQLLKKAMVLLSYLCVRYICVLRAMVALS